MTTGSKARRIWPRALRAVAVAACLIIPTGGLTTASWAAGEPGIFDTTATRMEGLQPFTKWTEMLERHLEELGKVSGDCKSTTFNKCHYQNWQALIAGLAKASKKSQLKAVNDYANEKLYVLDPVNWGVKDYWATPGEFFGKNGDCEDYSILKFLTLRKLGWDNEELRIVIVRDMNLKIAHAVLGVHYKKKIYVLDNQMTLVAEDRRIRHYRPIFSLNEKNWWRHK